jgi:hypothetical protein
MRAGLFDVAAASQPQIAKIKAAECRCYIPRPPALVHHVLKKENILDPHSLLNKHVNNHTLRCSTKTVAWFHAKG